MSTFTATLVSKRVFWRRPTEENIIRYLDIAMTQPNSQQAVTELIKALTEANMRDISVSVFNA